MVLLFAYMMQIFLLLKNPYTYILPHSAELLLDRVEVFRSSQPLGLCRAQSVYLTTLFLGRLSPLSSQPVLVQILSPETDNCPS